MNYNAVVQTEHASGIKTCCDKELRIGTGRNRPNDGRSSHHPDVEAEAARRFFASTRMTRTGRQTRQPKRLSYSPTHTFMAKREVAQASSSDAVMPSPNSTYGATTIHSRLEPQQQSKQPLSLCVQRGVKPGNDMQPSVSVPRQAYANHFDYNGSNENDAAATNKRKRPSLTIQTAPNKEARLLVPKVRCSSKWATNSRPPRPRGLRRKNTVTTSRPPLPPRTRGRPRKTQGVLDQGRALQPPGPRNSPPPCPRGRSGSSSQCFLGGDDQLTKSQSPSGSTAVRSAFPVPGQGTAKSKPIGITSEPYALAPYYPNHIKRPMASVVPAKAVFGSVHTGVQIGGKVHEESQTQKLLRMEYAIERGYCATKRTLNPVDPTLATVQEQYASLVPDQHLTASPNAPRSPTVFHGYAGLTPPQLEARFSWFAGLSSLAKEALGQAGTSTTPALHSHRNIPSFQWLPPAEYRRQSDAWKQFLTSTPPRDRLPHAKSVAPMSSPKEEALGLCAAVAHPGVQSVKMTKTTDADGQAAVPPALTRTTSVPAAANKKNSLEPTPIPRDLKGALAPTPLMSKCHQMVPRLSSLKKPHRYHAAYPAPMRSSQVRVA